jgi:squalene-hopene/tetraprenyl-beta-curcumene cyclase
MNRDRLRAAYVRVRDALLAERTPAGYWLGELSSSALSTATAVAALHLAVPDSTLIDKGLRWLAEHQNTDGGWGDTVKSFSNISTTMLCRAAFHLCDKAAKHPHTRARCETWLAERYGRTPAELAEAIRQRYGKDRTFAVPILTMAAIAGLVPWNEVPRLPFELACLPQSWYRFAHLPVVSYALPALIAIGQCVHAQRGTWNPLTKTLRFLGKQRSLRVLERIQPSSGGFLEATPLTSFVVMSLAAVPRPTGDEPAQRVMRKGAEFILHSVRDDGSWPIDSNLSIWVTTLAVNALAAANDLECLANKETLADWLLSQQMKQRHPYTGAAPGGWGWSHLPGSVPDCDDTPGALLALRHLATVRLCSPRPSPARGEGGIGHSPPLSKGRQGYEGNYPPTPPFERGGERQFDPAVTAGAAWVLALQNRDGGWPTFCRGWGVLPFDRSGCDLTAHALRSLSGSALDLEGPFKAAQRYLAKQQRSDGSWLPLWFGNQHAPDDINPTYGTAKVLAAYRDLNQLDGPQARKAIEFLRSIQNTDGGWGGAHTPSSVEETALAVEVLLGCGEECRAAVQRGLEYLVHRVEDGTFNDAAPIGFYFAKLWYFEKLYPIIFTVAALGRALRERLS